MLLHDFLVLSVIHTLFAGDRDMDQPSYDQGQSLGNDYGGKCPIILLILTILHVKIHRNQLDEMV